VKWSELRKWEWKRRVVESYEMKGDVFVKRRKKGLKK
jgi:hypothetical protein